MNEDLEIDAWIVLCEKDGRPEELADAGQVLVLAVNDPDHGADVREERSMIVVGGEAGDVRGDL